MKELRHVSIFSALSDQELETVARYSTVRHFKKNAVVINEGDVTDSLYIISEGRVKVCMSDDDGREIVINDLDKWNYFGELAILDGSDRSASIVTCEDSSFIVVSREAILRLLENPDTALTIIRDLVKRIRELSVSVKDMALSDVYKRLKNLLLKLVEEKDGLQITRVPLTQEEIANRVGAARESVTRVLITLKEGGYIRNQGKHIIIDRKLPDRY